MWRVPLGSLMSPSPTRMSSRLNSQMDKDKIVVVVNRPCFMCRVTGMPGWPLFKTSYMSENSQVRNGLAQMSKWFPLYSEPCLKTGITGRDRAPTVSFVSAPGRPWGDGPWTGLHLQPSHYFCVYCVLGSAPGRTGHLYPSHDLSAAKGFALIVTICSPLLRRADAFELDCSQVALSLCT